MDVVCHEALALDILQRAHVQQEKVFQRSVHDRTCTHLHGLYNTAVCEDASNTAVVVAHHNVHCSARWTLLNCSTQREGGGTGARAAATLLAPPSPPPPHTHIHIHPCFTTCTIIRMVQ